MASDFQRKIQEITRRIPEVMKRLPGVAKVEGLQFIADNFKNEGFETTPGSYRKWKKKKIKGARKQVLTGEKRGTRLKKSWKQDTKATGTTVEFTSALPYSAVHNEGLKAGRPPGFTMPQRQMIGPSKALNQRIESKFKRMIDEIFK